MSEESPGKEAVAAIGRALHASDTVRRARIPSAIYLSPATPPAARATWQEITLIGVFLISIALPLAGMLLELDSGFVLVENRVLASRPELKLDRARVAEFPARFEAYFNDQFGFRKPLIRWLNTIKVTGLGISPSPKVILARDGWLFHGDLYLDYYRAAAPFTPERLEMWQRLLESRRDWLAARGIRYLIVFVPIKSTVYPEHVPRVYNRIGTETRLDQLKARLKTHSNLTLLDLREPLIAAKSEGQLYYRTDTHWNNRGAYAGYTKIIEALSAWYPRLRAIPRTELVEQTIIQPGGNLSLMLAMSDDYLDSDPDLRLTRPKLAHEVLEKAAPSAAPRKLWTGGPDIVYEHPDHALPRAVMFRDSFTTWLIPLISEHFRRIVFSWQHTMERELVEREHPDIVIQEILERALMDWRVPSE